MWEMKRWLYSALPWGVQTAPKKAILTALAIIKTLKSWNVERQKESLPPIEMGISVHTGDVLAGNMGAENRLNYTVLGSSVNLAARLCDVAKGMQILITKEVLKEPFVEETFTYEALVAMSFKGFDLPVEVFCVTGLKSINLSQ